MKTKHLLYMTLFLCSLLFVYTNVADAQKVHACLILLGNDPNETHRASIDINQEAMIGLMQLVSRNADVHMTLMKSEPGLSGEVRNTHLVNTQIKAEDYPKQLGIIKPTQVTQWIQNLKVGPSDTVLVYFNGHGKVDRYGTHQLLFDKTKRLARDVVLEALKEKPGRLKMLITDTCSEAQEAAQPAGRNDLTQYGDTEAKPQFYARNLFLEHTGILDITATSPEIRTARDTDKAFGDAKRGGFFTYALTTALVPDADTNGDDFLSWEEAFAATKAGTKWLCENHPLMIPLNIIQQPVAYALPKRIDSGSGMGIPTLHALLISKTERYVEKMFNESIASIDNLLRGIESSGISELKLTSLRIDDPRHILQPIQALRPRPNDIVFVYYIGTGHIDQSGELYLGNPNDMNVSRKEVVKSIQGLQCRLKILITDSDSSGPSVTEPMRGEETNTSVGTVLVQQDVYRHLLLQHEGFLNLTTATEGESAIGHSMLGSHFTHALISTISKFRDTDGDRFASWGEVFRQTRQRTMSLFSQSTFSPEAMRNLERRGIESQRPKYYGELPKRHD